MADEILPYRPTRDSIVISFWFYALGILVPIPVQIVLLFFLPVKILPETLSSILVLAALGLLALLVVFSFKVVSSHFPRACGFLLGAIAAIIGQSTSALLAEFLP